MEDQLNLSPAQKASFQAIFARHKDSMAANRKASFAARQAFKDALQKPETTPDALKALHRTLSDLRFDGLMERRAMRQELRAVLNPDQREQAARMEGRMEGMRMVRSGRRAGWGEGGFPGGMKGWHRSEAPAPAPAAPATAQ
jgi:Spy/CpxP family protein refolding chaperone